MVTFVWKDHKAEARDGYNDDLVMGLVLFSWLTAQSYFKEDTNIDIRKMMLEEQNMLGDEDLAPVGIIDDGRPEPVIDSGGTIWQDDVRSRGYISSNF